MDRIFEKLNRYFWKRQADIPCGYFQPSAGYFSPQPPVGGVCRYKHVSRSDYTRGNESATDFSYAIALVRRRYTDDDIIRRILSERTDWKNHRGERRMMQYLERTVRKARIIAEQTSISPARDMKSVIYNCFPAYKQTPFTWLSGEIQIKFPSESLNDYDRSISAPATEKRTRATPRSSVSPSGSSAGT